MKCKDYPISILSKRGLISDGKVFPEDSVQECLNMDYHPDEARRNPYIEKFAPTLPEGYIIKKAYNKRFIDKSGNTQEIIFLMVIDNNSRLRIYSSHYYNSGTGYDNRHRTDYNGFYSGLTELTEYYFNDFEVGEYLISGTTYNVRIETSSGPGNQTTDAYKGFYVFNVDNEVIGIVKNSIYDTGKNYFLVDIDDTQELGNIGICRFPVNHWNRTELANFVDEITFADLPNAIMVSLGHATRPLWIGMIKDRKQFKNVTYDITYAAAHTGWIAAITGTANYIGESKNMYFKVAQNTGVWVISYSRDNTNWIKIATGSGANFDGGVRIEGIYYRFSGVTAEIVDGDVATVALSVAYLRKWDGFWMGFTTPDVQNKKQYILVSSTSAAELFINKATIGFELGISIRLERHAEVSTLTKPDRIYQYCIEIDGSQTIFISSVLCNEKYFVTNAFLKFAPYYDRRITGYSIFGAVGEEVNPAALGNAMLPETKLIEDAFWSLSMINGNESNNQIELVLYYDFTTHTNTTTHSEDMTKGMTILKYLNQHYWKNIIAKGKYICNVNNNIILLNLSTDTINADLEEGQKKDIAGQYSLVVSQVQKGNVNTYCIFSSERIREVMKELPVGIAEINGNEFVIFSKNEIRWLELIDTTGEDMTSLSVRTHGYYNGKGALNNKGIASATVVNFGKEGTASSEFGAKEFSGIFYLNYDTILGFNRNEPEDLLDGYWKTAYKAISNYDKENAVFGYYAAKNEIWIKLGEYIYIFDIVNKTWRVYLFYHPPIGFLLDENNQLLFYGNDTNISNPNGTDVSISSNKVFSTITDRYRIDNNIYRDPDSIGIEFKGVKYLTLGKIAAQKIFHRLQMVFDFGTTSNYTNTIFKVRAYRNASSDTVLAKDYIHTSGNTKKAFGTTTRNRVNTLKLLYGSYTKPEDIKQFYLYEMNLIFKLTGSTITKF